MKYEIKLDDMTVNLSLDVDEDYDCKYRILSVINGIGYKFTDKLYLNYFDIHYKDRIYGILLHDEVDRIKREYEDYMNDKEVDNRVWTWPSI